MTWRERVFGSGLGRRRPTPWPQPDFLGARRITPPAVWALLATGLFLFAFGVHQTLDLRRTIAAEGGSLGRAGGSELTYPPLAGASAVESPQHRTVTRDAAKLAAAARHPWGELLGAVESAAPAGVQWLRFEHDSSSADLRLEGSAPDASAAIQTVDALAVQPGWTRVVLTRLAASDTRTGPGGGVRFDVAARVMTTASAEVALDSAN